PCRASGYSARRRTTPVYRGARPARPVIYLTLAALFTFLGINGYRLTLSNDEAYEFIMALSSGEITDLNAIARTIADRKSTRLNSSHVSISYAVFCLKKK